MFHALPVRSSRPITLRLSMDEEYTDMADPPRETAVTIDRIFSLAVMLVNL